MAKVNRTWKLVYKAELNKWEEWGKDHDIIVEWNKLFGGEHVTQALHSQSYNEQYYNS